MNSGSFVAVESGESCSPRLHRQRCNLGLVYESGYLGFSYSIFRVQALVSHLRSPTRTFLKRVAGWLL